MELKTFKDYITAYENYDYSHENYELIKECSELTVLEKYIDNQRFLLEHADITDNESFNGYLMESVSESNLEVLVEKANKTGEGILKKIYNGISKIIGVFAKLLKKIGNLFDTTTKDGQAVLAALKNKDISEKDLKEINDLLDTAIKKSNGFKPFDAQPFAGKVILKTDDGCDAKLVATVRNKIAAALSNTYVVASVVGVTDGSIGAIPIEDLKDAAAGLALNPKANKTKLLINSLSSSFADAKIHGIKIAVNTNAIDKSAEQLLEIQNKLNSMISEKLAGVNTATNIVNQVVGVAKDAARTSDDKEAINTVSSIVDNADATLCTLMNTANSMINATVGASMRVYNGLNVYRRIIIEELGKYTGVKNSNENKDDESK